MVWVLRILSPLVALAAVAFSQSAGDPPPALSWSKLKGNCPASLDWASLRGQVVVLSFEASPVLSDEIAEWNDVAHKFPGEPVVFIHAVNGSEFLLDQALKKTASGGCILFEDHEPDSAGTMVVDRLGLIAGYLTGDVDEHAIQAVLNHETPTGLSEKPTRPYGAPIAIEDDVSSWDVHISPAPKNEFRTLGTGGPDRYSSTNQTLRLLIPTLWDTPMVRIVFPTDLDERSYDVTAHIPVADWDQLLKLVREAVENYFGLHIEKETRMERVYRITALGSSPQRQPAANGEQEMWGRGPNELYGTARTMPEIAESLAEPGTLVVDETGLKGKFDYTASSEASGPQAVLDMAQQLGLELTPTEKPVEMLVVHK